MCGRSPRHQNRQSSTRQDSFFLECFARAYGLAISKAKDKANIKQDEAYNKGNSKVKFPNGKHNKSPSVAVDVAPYPINWRDRDRFHYFAGYVLGIASQMGIKIRWGGDWDMDTQTKDNNFDDLVHFEIKE